MDKVRLGRTELMGTKTSFGALPIQRISEADAVKLVRRAYESGINYFDTANMYTDSEAKLGKALHDVRQNVVISTKSAGTDKKTVLAHIEESLRRLQTDYIDLFQFHNPAELPDPEDPDGRSGWIFCGGIGDAAEGLCPSYRHHEPPSAHCEGRFGIR